MADETSPLLRARVSNAGDDACAENGHNNASSYDAISSAEEAPVSAKSYLSVVLPMGIGIFLAAMDGTIVISSYAAIGSELNQLQNTSWIATAYMLTLTSFQPLYGKLSDIFGRKGCLLFAYAIFAIGCLLCGMARNLTELIVSRAFAGIGGGGMTTIVSIILSDIVPLRSRGTWQGFLNIIFATGSATGAPLGGFLVDSIGWRWAFLLQVPIALIAIISVSHALHLPQVDQTDFSAKLRRVDFSGALTLIVTVFLLLLGLDRGGNVSWSDPLTITALVGFAIFFTLFLVIELELASEPFAPKRIIMNPSLIAGYLVNFFGIAAGMTMLFHVSLFLQAVEGKNASETSLWLIFSVVGGLCGSLGGGLTMQTTGKFYTITVLSYALLFMGSSVVLLMSGFISRSTVGVTIGLVMGSTGNGCGVTTSLIALIANAGQADQAIATAVSYLFRSLGTVVGVSIGSTILQETLRTYLRHNLTGDDVEEIIRRVRESLSYLNQLDPVRRAIVVQGYASAVQATFCLTLFLAACSFISSFFIREKALSSG